MPGVRLPVVAEDKACLGRRPYSSKCVPLSSWGRRAAIVGMHLRTELLPSTVPSSPYEAAVLLCHDKPRPTGSKLVGLLEESEIGSLPRLAAPESLFLFGIVPVCCQFELPL